MKIVYPQLMHHSAVANPKRRGTESGRGGWYPYYAGYSVEFARSAIASYRPLDDAPLLDPWNGGGTTTQACMESGIESIGCDINPVMVVVAKARRIPSTVKESIAPLTRQLLDVAIASDVPDDVDGDPLRRWFGPQGVRELRRLELTIRRHFLPSDFALPVLASVANAQFSDLAAYFYLLLFRGVRRLLVPFQTSNPTWIKTPHARYRLRPDWKAVSDALTAAMEETLPGVDEVADHHDQRPSRLLLCDSRSLPIKDGTVGGILTSPPYLTRIDYAVSTSPELAVLGYGDDERRDLRERMLGTTTVTLAATEADTFGPAGDQCLRQIADHGSKASKSYYWKNVRQYLSGIRESLVEASRVLAPGAPAVLVVQDSYYKDVRIDLAKIVREIGEISGLEFLREHPFVTNRHMGRVHPHRNQKISMDRIESVVAMRKPVGSYAN